MNKRRDKEIDQLLNEAQSGLKCLAANNHSLNMVLKRRVGATLVNPYPRLYARLNYWSNLSRRQQEEHVVKGMAELHQDWIFCNASAALLHGLPISFRHLNKAHVLSAKTGANTNSSSRIARHARTGKRQPVITSIKGVKVTSLEDTIVDCLLSLNFREGLAIADAALSRLQINNEALDKIVSTIGRGRPGVRRARETVRWADCRSESGGESIARAIIIERGFMLPELQVVINDSGRFGGSWRVDFFWKLPSGITVAGELDGSEKYINQEMTGGKSTIQVMSAERIRESRITLAVDRVMRFTYTDITNEGRLVSLLEKFGIPRVRQNIA